MVAVAKISSRPLAIATIHQLKWDLVCVCGLKIEKDKQMLKGHGGSSNLNSDLWLFISILDQSIKN